MTGEPTDLRRAAVGGVASIAASQIARQGLQIGITAVLARCLAPADFGLVGMASVALAFAAPLNELGMGAALVQKRDATPSHASSVFWCQILLSIALAGAMMAAAPFIAGFFGREEITGLLQVLCLNLPLGAAAGVPQALLARRLQFGRLAIAETIALAGAGTVAVAAALSGRGVQSLVLQSLAGSALTVVLMAGFARFNPFARGAAPRVARVRELAAFSGPLTGYQVLNYVSRNIDDVLIGRFLGAEALGYYSMAYRVMMYPLQKISGVVGRVAFPAFSSIEDDLPRMRRVYLRAVQYVALLTFPMMATVMVTCPEFTRVFLGERWAPAVPLIAILSVAGMAGSIGTTTGAIFLARGRTGLMLRWETAVALVVTTAVLVGLPGGLRGVTISFTIAALLLWPVSHLIANRLIGQSTIALFAALAPPAALAAFMALVLAGLRLAWAPSDPAGQILFLGAAGLAVTATYVAAFALGRPAALKDLVALGLGSIRRPAVAPAGPR